MNAPSPAMQKLLDTVPEGCRCVCIMVPSRSIRILQVGEEGHTFRVEQAMAGGTWRALNTHTNIHEPWAAYYPALEAAAEANAKLTAFLRQKARAKRDAMLNSTVFTP